MKDHSTRTSFEQELNLVEVSSDQKGDPMEEGEGKAQRILEGQSERTWPEDIELVAEHFGDQAAHEVLQRIQSDARSDLLNGDRAMDVAVTSISPTLEETERFRALLSEVRNAWRPTNYMEELLVGHIAQVQYAYETWMKEHMFQATHGSILPTNDEPKSTWKGRRLDRAESVELSLQMAQRWQNQILRLVRALRDLRKVSQQVFIAHAGQVNVADKQINVVDHAVS